MRLRVAEPPFPGELFLLALLCLSSMAACSVKGAAETACQANVVGRDVLNSEEPLDNMLLLSDGELVFRVETHGDPYSLCPDCQNGDFDFCEECRHDVLLVDRLNADQEVVATSILDEWFPDRAAHIEGTEATVLGDGTIAAVWRRYEAYNGFSPSQGMFAHLTPSGALMGVPTSLYAEARGDLRVLWQPEQQQVLVLRDSQDEIVRAGVYVRWMSMDGGPLSEWIPCGSSLAANAVAAVHGDGFVIALADPYPNALDPDCVPCTTFEECGRSSNDGSWSQGGDADCNDVLGASEAGGLQLLRLGSSEIQGPVQIRTGWYDEDYQGQSRHLFSDFGAAAIMATENGFRLASAYQGALVLLDINPTDWTTSETILKPKGRIYSPWYRMGSLGGHAYLLGWSNRYDGNGESYWNEVRYHFVIPLDEPSCGEPLVLDEMPWDETESFWSWPLMDSQLAYFTRYFTPESGTYIRTLVGRVAAEAE